MAAEKPLKLCFAGFELDEANARLSHDGRPVALQPRALALLCELARQPGRLLSKEALLDAVWGHRHVSESALKTAVSALRQALGDDPRQARFIETAARQGYRFIGLPVLPPTNHPLIGRGSALQQLQRAWQRSLTGRQLVWITGEAGIGKTCLLEAFITECTDTLCVRGQCLEHFGSGEPYLPWLELLGELSRRDGQFVSLLRTVAPMWLLQLPWLCAAGEHETLRSACGGANSQRMLREMAELLARYSSQRRLLLVLEDLHWCDTASLRLLEYLARRREPAQLLLLCSLRAGELLDSGHPLASVRHDLNLRGLSEEVALQAFSLDEVTEYLARRHPRLQAGDEMARLLFQRSGGLPLFVESLAGDLHASGTRPDWPLPGDLDGLLRRQVEHLGGEARAMLEVASVCGAEFRVGVLAAVLGRDEARLQSACQALTSGHGWLVAQELVALSDGTLEGRFAFRHALYRQVFYLHLDAVRRAQLHRAVAAVLLAKGLPMAAELAGHFEQGKDLPAAVEQLAHAAEGAFERFAPLQALQFVRHALGLLEQLGNPECLAEKQLDLLLKGAVASAQLHGMASNQASDFYALAQALAERMPDSAQLGWGLAGIAQVRYGRGEYQAARRLSERVAELADRLAEPALDIAACHLGGMVCAVLGEHERGRQLLERGIELGQALAERLPRQRFMVDPLVTMLGHLALHLLPLGLFEQASGLAEAALVRAQELAQPVSLVVATRCAGMLDLLLGRDVVRVARRADELAHLHSCYGLPQAAGAWRILSGWVMAQTGEPAAGYACIREGGATLQRLGMLAGHVQMLAFAAEALLLGVQQEAALALIEEAEVLALRLGERARLPELWLLRARAALASGDHDSAEHWLRQALAEACGQGAPGTQLLALLALSRLPEPAADDIAALRSLCRTLPPAAQVPVLCEAQALTES
ncbi:ATP-binding protein [Pseudomonas sp. BMS12]|uniref:ATP-binding protein n=1 Tax=Pseudomonas sp. BMS12 TaxID=1796033 RepID=UPI00083B76DB|nr:AAA family ATPase [Pseudomonas sp. BMS12]